MAVSELAQAMIDWTSRPASSGFQGDTPAILGNLSLGQQAPDPRPPYTYYRGCVFYKPGGARVLGYFVGTMALTSTGAGVVALDWAQLAIGLRQDGSMFAGARFFESYDDLEPYPPSIEAMIEPPAGALADFEDAAATKHFNTSGDHYGILFDNGWAFYYALRWVTLPMDN